MSMKKKKRKLLANSASTGNGKVRFICLKCGEKEDIPKSVVDLLDGTDLEYEPNQPPQFSCEKCGGEFEEDQMIENICIECENEYSYGEK